jgi:hypothetical protein
MFQLSGQIVTYEIDAVAYMEAARAIIKKEALKATSEFANAALSRIPIRTGFVSGAFGTLSDLIGANARFNPIVAAVRKTLSLFRKSKNVSANGLNEYYYGAGNKILKTQTSGRQFATQTNNILKWEGDTLVFTYEVDITYFALNDTVGGHSPTAPWGAFVAGQKAFEDYMEEQGLANLPDLDGYIKPITKTFG